MRLDSTLFDELTEKAKVSPRLRMHYDLRDSAEDGSMRMLNALEPGTSVPVHMHSGTSEEIVLLRGLVDVCLYDESGNLEECVHLGVDRDCMAVHIPVGKYHNSVSLESGSVIIEFKNGKYDPETTESMLLTKPIL